MARGIEDTPLYTDCRNKDFLGGSGHREVERAVSGARLSREISHAQTKCPYQISVSISQPGSYFHKTGIRRANRNGRWIEASLRFGKSGDPALFKTG